MTDVDANGSPIWQLRFRCCHCRRTFSSSSQTHEYRLKRRGINGPIFRDFVEGLSNRQIARRLNVSEHCVRLRLRRLAAQALFTQTRLLRGKTLNEPVAYDGLENFARSQYEPNNIQHAIGMKSLFIYDFNLAPMNRKGRMSPRQVAWNDALIAKSGRFDPRAIRRATFDILERLSHRALGPLGLATDEHFQYRRALGDLRRQRKISVDHVTVSSRAARTYKSILFAINHADLLARQQVKAFARETISFSKTHGAMAQKYGLFMVWKNFMRPQFTKWQKTNPRATTQTPAMAAKITEHVLKFEEFFKLRLSESLIKLNSDWREFAHARIPFNRISPHTLGRTIKV